PPCPFSSARRTSSSSSNSNSNPPPRSHQPLGISHLHMAHRNSHPRSTEPLLATLKSLAVAPRALPRPLAAASTTH
ncbi:hypothetical protein COCCADRAFT_96805, partial [Bipolaris zeicola 26-R-13]